MLINWQAPEHVYLVCGKTDLRKGIDGLAMVVAENFGLDLYNNSLFLFCKQSITVRLALATPDLLY
ncbi:IS66 family insertion sequence element accessory protein TnpB [Limosilactobacillus reuteri]|uniref:IS66 family insertion sequence element accessory protein TnpB n=1 Tax=Limosilactobacillus reuteri TaxID=1598 RepID=UPI0019594E5F|nr:IS66 family insertion sequence element accessory protein TnpB [Limosilactobacillus reuteri]MBM6813342.1 IS66 family insertion sequence element accessory protein TnpB [Limosilactobacillus reuteri]